jgi:putative oxidoreductase
MTNTLTDVSMLGAGLLIARLTLGLLMAAHGSQKLFGWFGGHGLTATAGFFDSIGFRPGRLFAATASITEVLSGVLVTLGFLGPVGPALMIAVMIVAAVSMHWKNGLFAAANGIEVPLLYAMGAAALLFTGPGSFSLDAILGLHALSAPALAIAALAIGVLGGVGNLFARRPVAV